MRIFLRPRTLIPAFALAVAVAAVTACGGTDNATGGGDDLSIAVVQPVSEASVAAPFPVKLDSSVPLGPSESGKHHAHIWFDGNDADYLVVESDTTQVAKVAPGAHTMHVSLRNANHSPAGPEASIPITVTGGGAPSGPSGSPADAPPPPGGYGY